MTYRAALHVSVGGEGEREGHHRLCDPDEGRAGEADGEPPGAASETVDRAEAGDHRQTDAH